VTVPHDAAVDPTTAWTLSAWVKRNAAGIQHSVVEKYNWSVGFGNYAMRIGPDNKLRGYVISGYTYNRCIGTTSLAANVWYHVAVTFDSATDRLICYVNGVAETTTVAPINPPPSSVTLKIGARGEDGATKFSGAIDEVKIYDRALTAPEIAAEASL